MADGDAAGATRKFKSLDREIGCWLRGWMITGEQYAALAGALVAKGHRLIIDADAYAESHHLPLAYRHLEGVTPESVWTETPDVGEAWAAYGRVGDGDAIVKDWVKSAKHL